MRTFPLKIVQSARRPQLPAVPVRRYSGTRGRAEQAIEDPSTLRAAERDQVTAVGRQRMIEEVAVGGTAQLGTSASRCRSRMWIESLPRLVACVLKLAAGRRR